MSSDDNVRIFDQVKARIEEYKERDHQAIARGKEERDNWLRAQKEPGEHHDPES